MQDITRLDDFDESDEAKFGMVFSTRVLDSLTVMRTLRFRFAKHAHLPDGEVRRQVSGT